ncbi:N-acetylglucosamine-6-phosphate deacetylase [Cryptococcus deuterogattii 99/473]|uniref:N-acetylglucosamine-6-phosphate deacetylase n=2 Tax=Cryptococcus deuterogattii TaxID=1859096 RepID=A0A0D0SZS0_9TREE|nr:N-acetylglucosamine-6-phosphate deacetylase [Cryptococcus deuterogattii R265]KIR27941.1 N-acetylglucosamine-6-phosphate deacetylase [Cryptococcus deuterogattii LA55]KIR35512.1 N-acetylglucosamine-6-phosphate deacetylase [Cryptococcus deuterogattii MMRL2647]KIR38777.1 N-acetylglucosamine-6-phosphate deacetylase [Cryptococcus deuterogattii Ram5]KIR70961.1 N-acetylglucosamine-6-phosphate deacetylase [Cryptococcus deuterogattii CA1014]KIR90572.1 N-acetylglucosamine-6-phosphate deacetylase [Cryp
MSGIVRFTNGYLAMPDGTAVKADLYISSSSGKIISGQSSFYSNHSPCRTVDLQGNLLSPGLIDIQINGAWRVDFSELDVQAGEEGEQKYVQGLERVARRLARYGTTSFVPTIITQNQELYSKLLRLLCPRFSPGSSHILGYHAEGPFLSPIRKGAHSSTLLLTASPTSPIFPPGASDTSPMKALETVYGKEGLDQQGVKIITLAPDVDGVMDCIEPLTERGVVVSVGHSDASLEQAEEAFDKGARMITHLFNAMPPIHHRDPGVVGMLGHPTRRPYFGIIVDGLHSHPNTVRMAYGACKEGCVLVSDAQSIMDPSQPDGVIDWRPGLRFRKEGLKVLVDGTSTLAGSAAPLAPLAHNLSKFASISLPMALVCATKHPAECLGGEVAKRKGQLIEGFDADLCVFDWEGNVKGVWIMGEEIWRDGEGWVDGRGDGP